LHLNGRRVGDHVFAPDWTVYNKRVRYQVYDVTSLVKHGANTLAGLVGNGWYCGHVGWFGIQQYGKIPALLAQLEVTYADGSAETIVTDDTWKLHAGPIISSDLQMGENYDARQEITGWDQPGLYVSNWTAATEIPESCSLDEQVDQPVRETGELHPKSMTNTDSNRGQWTFDLGQNMAGVVRIKVSAPAGRRSPCATRR
jgi:alpha-L-rhamnosidase